MKYKEAPIGPKKKMVKPVKKRTAQRKGAAAEEAFDQMENKKYNKSDKKPMDIADALNKSKQGYSKKPRIKLSTKAGMKKSDKR